MRIFYVTADGSRVSVLERALTRDTSAPHHVEVATTADAVIGRVGTLEAVVVLVDSELPHTSTETAVSTLRTHLPRARIVVLSADPSAERAGRLLLAGADESLQHTQLSDLPARLARLDAGPDESRRIFRLGVVTDDAELAERSANAMGAAATRLTIDAQATLTAPDGGAVDAVQFDVLVFDERRPHPETAAVLHAASERSPAPAVVVVARAEDGTSWMRLGACEVVHEPDETRLVSALTRARQWRRTHVEQAHLRGKEARLRNLVESIPEGVLLAAHDGAILALNVAGLRLIGATGPRDVVGKRVGDLVSDSARAAVDQLLDGVSRGESRTVTLEVRHVDGTTAPVDVKAVPFQREPGRPAAMLALIRGASAVPSEDWQEIPLAYDSALESRLDELTRTLEEARTELLSSRDRVEQLRSAHESEQALWQARFDELTVVRDQLASSLQQFQARQVEDEARFAERLENVRGEERRGADSALAALRAEVEEGQRAWAERLSALDAERAAALSAVADLRTTQDREIATLTRRLAEEQRSAASSLQAQIDEARAELFRREQAWQAKFDEMGRAQAALETELAEARHTLANERDRWQQALEAERQVQARQRADDQAAADEALAAALAAARATFDEERETLLRQRDEEQGAAERALSDSLATARAAFDEERTTLTARLGDLDRAVKQAAEREAQIAIDTAVRSLRVRELEDQVEAGHARLVALERTLVEREQSSAAEQATAADLAAARQALEARVAELEAERSASQRNQASVLEASARSLQEAQQAIAQIERRATQLERDVEAMTRERDHAHAAFASSQALADEADRQVEAMRAESAAQESRLRDLTAQLEARDSAIRDLEEHIRAGEQAMAEATASTQAELSAASARLDAIAGERETARSEAAAARAEIEATRARTAAAEAHLAAVGAERQQLEDALAGLSREREDLVSRLDTLEQRRSQYDERYRWLFDFEDLGRMVVTRDGTVVSANETAALMCGARTSSDFVGLRPRATEILSAAHAAAETRNGALHSPRRFEVCLQHADGYLHWVLGVAQPQDAPDAPVDWMLLDVSDRHLTARRSRYLRRVDALTHFLTSATTECAGLMGEVGDTLKVAGTRGAAAADAEQWQHAQKAVARTRSVLQQLSGFAQKRSRRPEVLELNDVLDKASVLLNRLAGEETPCETRGAGEEILVSIDPGEFEQLLTNAVLAARDSLPAGGRLTVTAHQQETDAEFGGLPLTRREAVVTIDAEGFGAAEGIVSPKLVDLVTRVGGQLDLKHEPEVRTTFQIALPVVYRINHAEQAREQSVSVPQPHRS